jgi:hypothetical protein
MKIYHPLKNNTFSFNYFQFCTSLSKVDVAACWNCKAKDTALTFFVCGACKTLQNPETLFKNKNFFQIFNMYSLLLNN